MPKRQRLTNFSTHHTEGTPSHVAYMHVRPTTAIEKYHPVMFSANPDRSSGMILQVADSGDRVAGVADISLTEGVDGVVAISGMVSVALHEPYEDLRLHDVVALKHCIGGDNNDLPVGTFVRHGDPIFMGESKTVHIARIMLCPWLHAEPRVNRSGVIDEAAEWIRNVQPAQYESFSAVATALVGALREP
jgi:hypothetical protein